MAFNPSAVKVFRFISYDFNRETCVASFVYGLDEDETFTEELIFTGANTGLSPEEWDALDLCLRHLHLMLGISYYKSATPPIIVIETGDIDEETARFFEGVYLNGLGEFAYRNRLDLRGRINFPCLPGFQRAPSSIPLKRKTAVPVGGGKDSVVSIEALKSAGEPIVLFSLGRFEAITLVARVSGIPLITVGRRLSPRLFELNGQGAFNGHIPISAIIAFVLPVCAILYGFDGAALSNERSASAGNLHYGGMNVNHQYSKGLEFERFAAGHFRTRLLKGFDYFSFLRPLSELRIASLFSRSIAYHEVFTSCNAAFRINEEKGMKRWCCDCPKCRSTFLLLAPFIEKRNLISIFGRNLLDEEEQMDGFEQLLGVRGFKPFECVGEPAEYMTALALLEESEWRNDEVVRFLQSHVPSGIKDREALVSGTLSFSDSHAVPPRYEALLRAYSGS